ncbi:hypothetical protein Gohar_007511, partial [Gossypium harknessii]|nr:hypothetical protein [Gossypium harknessii]
MILETDSKEAIQEIQATGEKREDNRVADGLAKMTFSTPLDKNIFKQPPDAIFQ